MLAAGFLVAADIRVAAPLLPAIAGDFGTSVGTAGLTLSLYALAYAGGQVVYGRLGDRFGRVRVLRMALLIAALGTASCSAAPSLQTLLALRLGAGAFAAAVIPMSLAYLGDSIDDYDERRRSVAIFLSVLLSGQVLGQAFGGLLSELLSWRAIFLLIGALGVTLAGWMWRYSADVVPVRPAEDRQSFRQIAAANRTLFLLTACETFVFLGAFAFAGASLTVTHGASYALSGALLGLFALGSLATSKGLDRLALPWSDAARVALGSIVVAAGFAVLATTPQAALFGVAVFFLGLGLTFAHSTLQTRATEVSPRARGTAVSVFAGSANVGAAVGTLAAGAFVDWMGYGTMFAAAAGGMVLVAAAGRSWLARLQAGTSRADGA